MTTFYKKILSFILFGIPIICLFLLPCILVLPYQTGGFGSWGIPFGPYDTIFHQPEYCFVDNIDNFDSLREAEIISIGDSFSQGGISGYQNFLGHILNTKVSNFRFKNARPENTAYTLLKKNLIPKCKILIVESVERAFIKSLSDEFFIFDNIQEKEIITKKQENIFDYFDNKDLEIRHFDFDIKALTSFYKNKLSLTKKYKLLYLKEDMFTSKSYSKSLYIYDNINGDGDSELSFKTLSKEQIDIAKNNFLVLIDEAQKHNIHIIYLIPTNKYDLYYNYIENNPYPQDSSFDYFEEFDTTIFINTKKILLPYLHQGVKDIYRVNDTHWSIIAAQIVGEHLGESIKYHIVNK